MYSYPAVDRNCNLQHCLAQMFNLFDDTQFMEPSARNPVNALSVTVKMRFV